MSMERRCPWCGKRVLTKGHSVRTMMAQYRHIEELNVHHSACPACAQPLIFTDSFPLFLCFLPFLSAVPYGLFIFWHYNIAPLNFSYSWPLLYLFLSGIVLSIVLRILSIFFGVYYRQQTTGNIRKFSSPLRIPVQLIIEAERRIPLRCEKVLVVRLPLTPAQIYKKTSERHRELTAFFERSTRHAVKGKHIYEVGFLLGKEIDLEHITPGMPITVVLRDDETAVNATVRRKW